MENETKSDKKKTFVEPMDWLILSGADKRDRPGRERLHQLQRICLAYDSVRAVRPLVEINANVVYFLCFSPGQK